jgi:glycosyltransferase involved in cell wall biosynthesis
MCAGHFIEKYYGTGCDVVTIGGVDMPADAPGMKERRGVILGRLEDDVGLFRYLEVLKLLKQQHGIVLPIDVLGDGSRRSAAEDYMVRHDLEAEFHGAVPDVKPYLMRALFVFASSYLSVLESMAHRCLVVATWMSEMKHDYLKSLQDNKETALVSDDPDFLASELAGYLERPDEKAALLDHAEMFASLHTWRKVAESYLGLYRRGIGKG